MTWSRTGTAWGFDSDKGHDAFAADAKNLSKPARDWSAQGNARGAFQNAASMVEGEYRCDYAYHAQMEPLNAVALVAPAGDAVEIWAGTQSQTTATEAPAKFLGIPRDKVKLHDLLMGGGFGRRGNRDVDFIMDAVMLSKEVGSPVKVMWTREDDVHNGRFRPMSAHYLRAAFDASGKLSAWHHRLAADRITPFMDPVRFQEGGGKDGMVMAGTDVRGYDVPHQLVEQIYRDTGVRTNPLRGIGVTANKFATEAFMDEVARKRGVDPLTYRLELLKGTPRAHKVVERVAQMADWGRKRDGRALGLAYIDYSGSQVAGIAEVSLDRTSGQIKVHNFWCTIDCGVAVQPDNVIAQTESSIVYGLGLTLSERISIKDGIVEQSNFYDYSLPRIERCARDAHRADPDRQPSDRSGADGDTADCADDIECDYGTDWRAAAAFAVHARSREEVASITLQGVRRAAPPRRGFSFVLWLCGPDCVQGNKVSGSFGVSAVPIGSHRNDAWEIKHDGLGHRAQGWPAGEGSTAPRQ